MSGPLAVLAAGTCAAVTVAVPPGHTHPHPAPRAGVGALAMGGMGGTAVIRAQIPGQAYAR